MNGADMGLGKKYELTAYNDQGEAKVVKFNVYVENTKLPQPGTFLHVSASKQIVVKWSTTEKDAVPEGALKMIRGSELASAQ